MRCIVAELCFDSFKYPGGIIQALVASGGGGSGKKKGSTAIIVEKAETHDI
jgi:hypothetical protein